jgi:hypothetical protein
MSLLIMKVMYTRERKDEGAALTQAEVTDSEEFHEINAR